MARLSDNSLPSRWGWGKLWSSPSISPTMPAVEEKETRIDIGISIGIGEKESEDRDTVVQEYEQKLQNARRSALFWLLHYKLTRVLGLCALTWSTVVLLGGFASDLPLPDFYILVVLLLLEVGRFACTLFFSELVRKDLVCNSQNPEHLNFKDIRGEIVSLLHFLFPIGQIVFVIPSLLLPLWRFLDLTSQPGASNLTISIRLFYLLILCNALVSSWHYSRFSSTTNHSSDVSIQRYFDELIWRGVHITLAQADDFNVFDFSFSLQARDYRCNVQRKVVGEAYEDFFRYLLAHRNGLEIVSTYLDSDDCFKKQAAVNIVGFWCNLSNPNLKQSLSSLSTAFLNKLLCKMEMRSQLGWDAANSLMLLVSMFKHLSSDALGKICKLTSNDNKDIVEFLTAKLDPNDSWSLCYLRLLAALLQHVEDRSLVSLKTKAQEGRVREILCNKNSRSRAKTYAAYALLRAGKTLEGSNVDRILVREPKDSYFHVHEVYLLDSIRAECDLKRLEESAWRGIVIRGDIKSLSSFVNTMPPIASIQLSCGNQALLGNGSSTLHNKSTVQGGGTLTTLRERVSLTYSHCWVGNPHNAKKV